MQLALLTCYEALVVGLNKAFVNSATLQANTGWGQTQYDDLQQMLGAIRAAEHALFAATHTLSERVKDAAVALSVLNANLSAIGQPAVPMSKESSFRYSTSLSSSSSLGWRYNSGSVWVTNTASARVPNGCPSVVADSKSISLKLRGGVPDKSILRKILKPLPKKKVPGKGPKKNRSQ